MIVTEEEAKTKRCQETIGEENGTDLHAAGMCIGSACMAWRWMVADRSDLYGRDNKNHGYCGKAGRP